MLRNKSIVMTLLMLLFSVQVLLAQAPEFIMTADDQSDTIMGNPGDIITLRLHGVPFGYNWGAGMGQFSDPTAAEIVNVCEDHDNYDSGTSCWWMEYSADPARGGAGIPYYYEHKHNESPVDPETNTYDDYTSEGHVDAASWEFEYGTGNAGPPASIDNNDASFRFYYSGYLGFAGPNDPSNRPGLIIQVKLLKEVTELTVSISNHTRFEFNWTGFEKV